MANRLSEASEWLAGRMKNHNATSLTITWKEQTATVSATRAKQMMRVGDDFGRSRIEFTDRDYIVKASDLEAAFTNFDEPVPGMRFTDSDGTFEAARFNGEQCYQRTPQGHQFRIHTKQVE